MRLLGRHGLGLHDRRRRPAGAFRRGAARRRRAVGAPRSQWRGAPVICSVRNPATSPARATSSCSRGSTSTAALRYATRRAPSARPRPGTSTRVLALSAAPSWSGLGRLSGSAARARAGRRTTWTSAAAGVALQQGRHVVHRHAADELRDGLEVAVAAAGELHVGHAVAVQLHADGARADAARGVGMHGSFSFFAGRRLAGARPGGGRAG